MRKSLDLFKNVACPSLAGVYGGKFEGTNDAGFGTTDTTVSSTKTGNCTDTKTKTTGDNQDSTCERVNCPD